MKAFLFILLYFVVANNTYSQNSSALKGSIERFQLHGKALEGNLDGDNTDRFVSVYLPPSYKLQTKRHFPVIYFLHGFTDDDAKFYGFAKHWMNLPSVVDSAFANGDANEMIIVTPDANTRFRGSWYSNSVTTGNWEDFITKELIPFIDARIIAHLLRQIVADLQATLWEVMELCG